MPERVLTDCFIEINSTNVSGANTSVAISESAEALDVTAMGDSTRKNIGGLRDWSMAMEFNADEALTGVFQSMLGTVVPVYVRASSEAISATNPSYGGDALMTEYTPLSGEIGGLHKVSLTFVSAGPLVRTTSAV